MRTFYDSKTKSAFMNAAREARKKGGTWGDAYKAASAVGYNGSEQGIKKMLYYSSAPATKSKPKNSKPKGRRAARRLVSIPTVRSSGNGMNAIQTMVNGLVKQRVREILNKAIETLKTAQKHV